MSQPSISIFFPAYNDAGTISSMVISAIIIAQKITDDYEIIVINDGSKDNTEILLNELKKIYGNKLKIITHKRNKGYGAALKSGFENASKELIFYTDGDAQYDVFELEKLIQHLKDDVDIVQGYKTKRNDPFHRYLLGKIYHWVVKITFGIKVKDVDCDFRLIRKKAFDNINLKSIDGTICVEMIKKFQNENLNIVECPVSHFHRVYGTSQFFNIKRLFKISKELSLLWIELVLLKRWKGKNT